MNNSENPNMHNCAKCIHYNRHSGFCTTLGVNRRPKDLCPKFKAPNWCKGDNK